MHSANGVSYGGTSSRGCHRAGFFPIISHGSLHLSRCTQFPWTRDVPALYRRQGGGFTVIRLSDGVTLGETETVEEAVKLIVANLPEGCGPAIIGTADDL
ncbi:DUF6193 family natural product biosynthesis protein [Streptomyces sp. NBC_00879]|uniref:DUF6193 family natural product biosynthesis protein n=1 Tax=Streptomyces sp. NBC_00879 TaxID=2975855 RepID=UPI00386C6BB2|nr:DUF6193 family natural product biosynthesis protein [Streptomyces sp. NBC_00879]